MKKASKRVNRKGNIRFQNFEVVFLKRSSTLVHAMTERKPRGLLERLDGGEVVIGDGGFIFCMEKRGYVKSGPCTPEATVEHPEAVRQLHREFLRAGADVMQTFTFYASEDKLKNRGHDAASKFGCAAVNQAACDLAGSVAKEGGALVCGNICQTPSFLSGKGKEHCVREFQKQLEVFVKNDVDFLIGEMFEHVEEAEWAIEAMKATGKPVVICMTISPLGDMNKVPPGECAVRMARAGADVVGVNCFWGPDQLLETIEIMKKAMEDAGLKRHLIIQPLGFHIPERNHLGFTGIDEFPFALESRTLTRWDVHKYARRAYDLGVRYIGGCCGFEPYHIRAIAEELSKERGKLPEASEKHGLWGEALRFHTYPWVRARARRDFWENIQPTSGRPHSAAMRKPVDSEWKITTGHEDLKQSVTHTTEQELVKLFARSDKQ